MTGTLCISSALFKLRSPRQLHVLTGKVVAEGGGLWSSIADPLLGGEVWSGEAVTGAQPGNIILLSWLLLRLCFPASKTQAALPHQAPLHSCLRAYQL